MADRNTGTASEMPWYEWDADNETLEECHHRRLMRIPALSPSQLDQLKQLRMTVWDGNLMSKSARSELLAMGLAVKWQGWQVISELGMVVLETLGYMNDDRWPNNPKPKARV